MQSQWFQIPKASIVAHAAYKLHRIFVFTNLQCCNADDTVSGHMFELAAYFIILYYRIIVLRSSLRPIELIEATSNAGGLRVAAGASGPLPVLEICPE
jgi:hypothetical protein